MPAVNKTTTKTTKIIFDPYCTKCQVWFETKIHNKPIAYCPDCSAKLIPQINCQICGYPVDGYWQYCGTCGVKIIRG